MLPLFLFCILLNQITSFHIPSTTKASNRTDRISINMTGGGLTLPIINKKISFPNIFNIFKSVQRTDKQLKDGIAKFYDESSQVWLDVWGEHMHHG